MTPEEARRLLQIHSGRDNTDPVKWANGFLVPLRSAPTQPNEQAFLEVMECIRVLAPEIAATPTVDRELMAALWGLIFLPRYWAFNPYGLENAIESGRPKFDGNQLSQLADRLDRIAEAVDYALNGMPDSVNDAMIGYRDPLPNYIDALDRHA